MSMPRTYGARAVRKGDSFQEGVTKLIPPEVLVGYAAAIQLLNGVAEDATRRVAAWVVFFVGLVATPLYMLGTWDADPGVRNRELRHAVPQLIVAVVAFVVWAFGLGVPFSDFMWYGEWMGGLALIAGTLLLVAVNRLLAGREG